MAQVSEAKNRAISPAVAIEYNGRDITADLSPYLSRFSFVDRLSGEADSLDIELAETHHSLSRWLAEWYPDKAMEVVAHFGYAHAPLVLAGHFEVDEVAVESPPMTVRIRALATGITKSVRTRQGRAYENTTLSAIADQVAKRLGATRKGKIEAVKLDRVTQYQESDWQFVVRLLREYGYVAKLTDNNKTLAVARLADLAEGVVRELWPGDLSSWSYCDRITDVPARSAVAHHNPKTGKLVIYQAEGGQLVPANTVTAKDADKKVVRAKTPEQAKAKATAMQERHEADKTSFECVLPGDPALIAGAAVDVRGLSRLDGRYVIQEARHEIDVSGGYATSLSMKRLREQE
jgi:phage protein D